MINVCHITENPIAGAPISLSNALNKWQGDKVHSRHIASSDRNENRVFKSDLLTSDFSHHREIRYVIENADVLHFHNFYSKCELFRRWPDLWKVALCKARVWQAHSPRSTEWMDIQEGLRDEKAKHLVIGQYHPRQWPECEIVPNVIDITDPLYTPQEREWDAPLRVAYSPSRIGLGGWDDKGYEVTKEVLVKLVNEGLIKAHIIFDRSHEDCMKIRGASHIGIDEVVTGSYHLCSLESMSQGLCTIAGLDALQVDVIKKLTGGDQHPWLVARPHNLEQQLRMVTESPALAKRYAHESRAWMLKHWHPQKTTQRFVDIYKKL